MNLPHKVSLVIPSVSSGHELPPAVVSQAVDKVARELSAIAGGCTASPAIGYWVSENGELVREPVTQVWSFTDHRHIDELTEHARLLAIELKATLVQEAFAIEIDNVLEIL